MATPLTDSINALTTYANEVTGASDTNLSDAVHTLASGYGGGGASNIITGTFKGTTTGAAMSIDLPYTGRGYPIAVVIYPTDGAYNDGSDFYNLIQRYAIVQFVITKSDTTTAPTYGSTAAKNRGAVLLTYKSSDTNAKSITRSSATAVNSYSSSEATVSDTLACRLLSATRMSVFIASTSYGFAANIEYTYHVIYSE